MVNENSRVTLGQITVRNRLKHDINNVKIVYGASNKSQNHTGVAFEYWFNWATVDLENETNIIYRRELPIGDIGSSQQTSRTGFDVSTYYRGYWQIHFEMNALRYSINKNNAQVNMYALDDASELEITLLNQGEYIRVNFQSPSGTAYFYVENIA